MVIVSVTPLPAASREAITQRSVVIFFFFFLRLQVFNHEYSNSSLMNCLSGGE